MEIRELTISFLAFWDAGCGATFLDSSLISSYIRRRNQWITGNVSDDLLGLLLFNRGKAIGFVIAMPIEKVPLPVVGEGYGVVLCNWVDPDFASLKYKSVLVGAVVEKLKHRGFGGVISTAFYPNELPMWESFGFSFLGKFDFWGFPVNLLMLQFVALRKPVIQRVVALSPPRQKKYALDVFAPSYCPLGVLVVSRIIKQSSEIARFVELRIHDTGLREVVIKTGRVFGVFLNNVNITRYVLAGVPIIQIIERFEKNSLSDLN